MNSSQLLPLEASVEDRENALDMQANALVASADRQLQLMYPWVLVRVLPREQVQNGIVLVEKQNKVSLEGLVISTWAPFYRATGLPSACANCNFLTEQASGQEDQFAMAVDLGARCTLCQRLVIDAIYNRPVKVWTACDVQPGDHVLFPHWAGSPIPLFDDRRYRVIKSVDWEETKDGGIFAVIDYEEPQDALSELLVAESLNSPRVPDMVDAIRERFLLIDRNKPSVTLSGL